MTSSMAATTCSPTNASTALRPFQSINYITSHDGFTLYDLGLHSHKQNWANGRDNLDGPRRIQLELRLGRRSRGARGGAEAAAAPGAELLRPG